MRGPHDVGGLPEGPIETEAHDLSFWEKQIDGIRTIIGAKGIVTTHENRRYIEGLGDNAFETLTYYERWTAALAREMVEKGILTQAEIDARVREIRERLAATGELAPGFGGTPE
jgi:hypothetical protein